MKKILLIANHEYTIYNFRLELVEKLISLDYEVIISCPSGEKIEFLQKIGCKFEETNVERHGKNPFGDLKLLKDYKKLFKKVEPDIVLSFTIKPNIYGAIACRKMNIPIIPNITGLGSAVENRSILQKIIVMLYKYSFNNIDTVFFQNEENRSFFKERKIKIKNPVLLPGSGINLNKYLLLSYPESETIKFVFISRIMKEKGIDLYLEVAKNIKKIYPNTEFHICGFCEEAYEDKIDEYEKKGIVIYHGMVENVSQVLKEMHCTVHPSYYPEGMSNILLESSASGRPIITTDRSGCREVVNPNTSGYLVPTNNYDELEKAIITFLELDVEKKRQMGLNGRNYVEENFNRDIVIEKYLEKIK